MIVGATTGVPIRIVTTTDTAEIVSSGVPSSSQALHAVAGMQGGDTPSRGVAGPVVLLSLGKFYIPYSLSAFLVDRQFEIIL